MNMKYGTVTINWQNNVVFKFNDVTIEYFGGGMLTDILRVNEFDKDGYISLEMNYGEETYYFPETLENLGVLDKIDLNKELSNIEGFKVVKRRSNYA